VRAIWKDFSRAEDATPTHDCVVSKFRERYAMFPTRVVTGPSPAGAAVARCTAEADVPPENLIQTGQQLRQAREFELKLTQEQLAERLRMTGQHAVRHLREMEQGQRPLSGPVAVAVGHMLERRLADA
jgi:hypothetical protein